jgi:hypothetical protein
MITNTFSTWIQNEVENPNVYRGHTGNEWGSSGIATWSYLFSEPCLTFGLSVRDALGSGVDCDKQESTTLGIWVLSLQPVFDRRCVGQESSEQFTFSDNLQMWIWKISLFLNDGKSFKSKHKSKKHPWPTLWVKQNMAAGWIWPMHHRCEIHRTKRI